MAANDSEAKQKKKITPAKNFDSFSTFVYRLIKNSGPDLHVSADTIAVLNDMGHTFIARLMRLCVVMTTSRKNRSPKTSKTKPLISSDTCKLALTNLIPEVTTGKFRTHQPIDSFRVALANEGNRGVHLWETYVQEMKKEGVEKVKFSAFSKLVFPLDRVKRMMRKHCPRNYAISKQAKVFVAFVLQYFYSEIIDMACDKTKNSSISTIVPRHLNLAIRDDFPVSIYFASDSIVKGHVLPGIHAAKLTLIQPAS